MSSKTVNIFIHGWSFSKEIWKDFYNLSDYMFVDLPFHGNNTDFPRTDIINEFSRYIASIVNNTKGKVNLIGWSLGASIAVKSVLDADQNKLNKLILIGFTPKFNDKNLGHNPAYIRAFLLRLSKNFKDAVYSFRENAAGNRFENISLPDREGSISLLREFINLDLTSDIAKVKTRTVLIHGRSDKIISYEGSVFASKNIESSKLILVDSHHAPFLTDYRLLVDSLD